MKRTVLLIYITLVLLTLISCKSRENRRVENYHPKEFADSLMVDIVTYMGKKPRVADHIARHDPVYRQYYTSLSKDFHFLYYFVSEKAIHYFYIIRPARHPLGNQRGVGGRFRLDQNNRIVDFEEIFVTRVLDESTLKEEGRKLFSALIGNGSIDKYPDNRQLIEWPDERCRYDMEKKEWRYDVDGF